MNSYLITGYFILANKTGTVSPQHGMQKYKRYERAMQKTKISMISQILPCLHELICYGIQNVDQTNICSDNVLHVICSLKLE